MSEVNNNTPNESKRPATKRLPSTRTILGLSFGIFMVFIYVGMGILLMLNFFGWNDTWTWMRYLIGVILVIYGFYRGWRQYKEFTTEDEE